jgi:TonB family protein
LHLASKKFIDKQILFELKRLKKTLVLRLINFKTLVVTMIKFLRAWSVGMTINAQTFRQQRFIAFQISKTKLFLPILLLLLSVATFAQRNISVRLFDVDTEKPVTDATIRIAGKDSTIQPDAGGYVKLTAEASDTLIVESLEYPIARLGLPEPDEFYIGLSKEYPAEILIFTVVEQTASFPGGMSRFYEYIGSNIKYPKSARKARAEGKVFVEFVINQDGTIEEESIKVVKGVHPELDSEAVRLIQHSPRWAPGTQRGKPVRQKFVLPIIFHLSR